MYNVFYSIKFLVTSTSRVHNISVWVFNTGQRFTLAVIPLGSCCPLVWMPEMKSNHWTGSSVCTYVASKKPGGRTLSRCAPEDAWKMAFIPLWIIMSWTSPTTLQTKIFLFPFFAHLIFIRKNEVITHLFPLENLESSPFAWYSTNYDGFFATVKKI